MMTPTSITVLFFFFICSVAVVASVAAASKSGCGSLYEADSSQWEYSTLLMLFVEGRIHDERSRVWATNLLLALAVAAVVSLRIWWTCGNLPPSDMYCEPALGRVLDLFTHSEADETVEEGIVASLASLFHIAALSPVHLRGKRRQTMMACAAVGPAASPGCVSSPACPCLSSYLPADITSVAAASSCVPPADAMNEEESYGVAMHHTEALSRSALLFESLRHCFLSYSVVRSTLEGLQVVNEHLCVFQRGCCTAWELLWMPFSGLLSISTAFNSCGQSSHVQPSQFPHHHHQQPHHTIKDTWTAKMTDISDEELEDHLVEQEGLWCILEGIERRRRALTGRNLFRQQLPPRSCRRIGTMATSTAWQQASPNAVSSASTAASALGAVVDLPTLATGVPLAFSTNRRARPMLVDRRGRWIPVAVIDEDGEYYNYNLDQVLPQI